MLLMGGEGSPIEPRLAHDYNDSDLDQIRIRVGGKQRTIRRTDTGWSSTSWLETEVLRLVRPSFDEDAAEAADYVALVIADMLTCGDISTHPALSNGVTHCVTTIGGMMGMQRAWPHTNKPRDIPPWTVRSAAYLKMIRLIGDNLSMGSAPSGFSEGSFSVALSHVGWGLSHGGNLLFSPLDRPILHGMTNPQTPYLGTDERILERLALTSACTAEPTLFSSLLGLPWAKDQASGTWLAAYVLATSSHSSELSMASVTYLDALALRHAGEAPLPPNPYRTRHDSDESERHALGRILAACFALLWEIAYAGASTDLALGRATQVIASLSARQGSPSERMWSRLHTYFS